MYSHTPLEWLEEMLKQGILGSVITSSLYSTVEDQAYIRLRHSKPALEQISMGFKLQISVNDALQKET